MKVYVGTGPDSWGVWFPSDSKQIPWQRFLDEAAQAEYEWIELGPYGYLPTDVDVLKEELGQRNLRVAGSFVIHSLEEPTVWPALEEEATSLSKTLVELGAKFLVLIDGFYRHQTTGELVRRTQPDEAGWKRLIDTTHRLGEQARDQFDLQLVFHPHCETHVETEDQIERFLADTDPALVNLCLDTGHHAYRGGDPVTFMRKHHQRITYLHFKSVDREVQRKVQAEGIPYATAVGMNMFCEPAEGVVDFPAFRDVLADVDWEGSAIVEQDMYPAPFDKPLPIARRTRAYLRGIGIG